MASFSDLVKAQRQSGRGVVTSLSGAYNQMNMQRYDPRNALFSKGGIMTSLFPGLKGYQASPVSGKSPSSMISPEISSSPTALNSIARDARISARNSMALPSIARNMAQMVRIWGGTPAKYFEKARERETAYESKYGGAKKGLPGLGKSAGGKGFNIMGMLGGALGGIGSVLGSVVGGVGSIIGSILGGIGSLVGGAFSGIFRVLGSALGGMGIMGVVVAGVVGFALYSLWKSLDFSKVGSGIGNSLSGIKEALSGLYDELDNLTGGKLSTFVDDTQKMFTKTVNRIAAGLETALTLFQDLGTAVIKDMYGFIYNIFKENQGKVLGMVTIGALAAFAGVGGLKGTLVAAAIGAAMSAYGALTSEKSLEEMKTDLENTKKSKSLLEEQLKTPNMPPSFYEARQKGINQYNESIKRQEAAIQEKEGRTNNTQAVLNRLSVEGFSGEYNKNLAKREAGSPTPAGQIAGNDIRSVIGGKEGGLTGYNASFGYGKGKQDPKIEEMFGAGTKLTDLTIGQVLQYAKSRGGNQGAVGKYQFMPSTLEGLIKDSNGAFSMSTKFSPETQDALYNMLSQRNAAALKAAGIPVTADNLHLAHVVGPGGAIQLIKNPDQNANIQQVLGLKGAGAKTNPQLNTSIADYRNTLASYYGAGKIYDTDRKMEDYAKAGKPTKTQLAGKTTSTDGGVAALVHNQVMALDKMMGGQLMKGSTDLADMLRDITREFMSNPTFVDSSQTVNNNMPPGLASAVTGSVYDPNVTVMMSERLIVGK